MNFAQMQAEDKQNVLKEALVYIIFSVKTLHNIRIKSRLILK